MGVRLLRLNAVSLTRQTNTNAPWNRPEKWAKGRVSVGYPGDLGRLKKRRENPEKL